MGFWWQQSLWKLPPLYTNHPEAPLTTGLTYWMHEMVQYAAIPLQSDLVNNVVLPHFYVFAPIIYAAEELTDVSLMLGMFTRLFGVIGALQLLNIWLGLYNASGEWPWTAFFLIVLQLMCRALLWPEPRCRRAFDDQHLRAPGHRRDRPPTRSRILGHSVI